MWLWQVGETSETVTVTEAAPLLKTDSGDLSHNVTTDRMDNLPMMGIGAQSSAQRRNDFGGTIGGPRSVPKLYNAKDRTFLITNRS